MPDARVAPTGQDLQVGRLHGIRANVVLHRQPGLTRFGHGGNEGAPRLQQALSQVLRAPFSAALLDLRRGKEQRRLGAGKSLPLPRSDTCVPPMELLNLRFLQCVCSALRIAALPAKSTYTQGSSAAICSSWS